MIFKSLIVTALLLFLYSAFIFFIKVPWDTGQHQWQENMIKAQSYIYSDNKYDVVIVGSSLAKRLKVDNIPFWYNLAFSSESSIDGLNIILKSGNMPKIVLVEINKLDKLLDTTFDHQLFNPITFFLLKKFPVLQEGHQPVGLFNFIDLFRNTEKKPNQKVFEQSLLRIKSQYTKDPSMQLVKSKDLLEKDLNFLIKNGVKVFFFEAPMNTEICSSTWETSLRKQVQENFYKKEYGFIRDSDCSLYETADGLHLIPKSAKIYVNYLQEQLQDF